ncbi:hypothetical protein CNY67_11700 [Desulfovibrio sp. G11]|nr:hypothetical protein CNY67_11700 [Desulfovibrio sp. G11]
MQKSPSPTPPETFIPVAVCGRYFPALQQKSGNQAFQAEPGLRPVGHAVKVVVKQFLPKAGVRMRTPAFSMPLQQAGLFSGQLLFTISRASPGHGASTANSRQRRAFCSPRKTR